MNTPAETQEKINLTFLNGTGYVFKVDDYMTLRRKHRIVGALVGTCNMRGWSAKDCTLPVEFSAQETRFLVERGIAQLVSKQETLLSVPDAEQLVLCRKQLEARFDQQSGFHKAEKLREVERNMSKILAGKRKKLMKEGIAEEDIKLDEKQILQEIADNFVFDRKNAQLEIPCAHAEPHILLLRFISYEKKQEIFPDEELLRQAKALKYSICYCLQKSLISIIYILLRILAKLRNGAVSKPMLSSDMNAHQ
ncbi:uncharacterized protein Tsen34 isoform X4 [Eurosta solidaginis]|uniref:uncharacterized protein Tsen34 isoform X4 n=1 Tax=Eurosta solidaginis TaxID=178769 RepID=UPI0035313CD4